MKNYNKKERERERRKEEEGREWMKRYINK
jgi:hypothetical protein